VTLVCDTGERYVNTPLIAELARSTGSPPSGR
jgi:hypothetical protein